MRCYDCFRQRDDKSSSDKRKESLSLEQRRSRAIRLLSSTIQDAVLKPQEIESQKLDLLKKGEINEGIEFDHLITKHDGLTLDQKELIFKAAVQSDSFTKVLDGSGRVIFTKGDYEHYQKCKKEIKEALNQKSDAKEIIPIMKKVPFFREIYKMDVGVWEKYTLEQHASMVLDQFSRYQAKNWDSPLLTKEEFGLMLAVHDNGKPQAFQETGKTSKQHEYNARLVPMILKWLEIPDKNRELMTALTVQDHLGGFLKKVSKNKRKNRPELSEERKIDEAREVAQKISQEAKELDVEAQEYFHLITAYFRADSGAYTVDAGGKRSLDFLFKEETPHDCTRAFSERTQHNYDIIAREVKSLSTSKIP